jgi:hypothetical protein
MHDSFHPPVFVRAAKEEVREEELKHYCVQVARIKPLFGGVIDDVFNLVIVTL